MIMFKFAALAITVFLFSIQNANAQCDSGWEEYDGNCYKVSATANEIYSTWDGASAACREEGANLASIHSQEEHEFIISVAEGESITVGMWLGLTRRSDPAGEFVWTDGSELDYTYWGTGEPDDSSFSHCAMTASSETSTDFEDFYGYTATYYIPGFDYPSDADGVDTFDFGGGYEYDSEWCKARCASVPECAAYSWADYHWDYPWEYHCTGRSDRYSNMDYEYNFYSGERRTPDLSDGWWFSENCGLHMGFVCKKPVGSDSPVTPAPTVPIESFCPEDYFSVGNKCYKIKYVNQTKNGFTWQESLTACQDEPYISAGLASIHSLEDNAAIAARLTGNGYGVWLGGLYESGFKEFTWTDNSEWTFDNWMDGEPSSPTTELCVQMMQTQLENGRWNDLTCEEKRGYVCQIYKDGDNPINTPPPTTPHDCEADWTPYNQGCYLLDEEDRSWEDADANCKSLDGDLVSIHSSAQNAAIYLSGGKLLPVWIGLKLSDSTGQFQWSDGWPFNYANWEDDGMANGTGCVALKDNGLWQNYDCTQTRASVCWKTSIDAPTTPEVAPGSCPSGDWMEYGEHCFYFDRDSYVYSWNEALTRCQELAPFTNVDMASIGSYMENEFMLTEMRKRGITGGWLGLKRVGGSGDFEWSDGSPLDFENWAPDEPNNGDGGLAEDCTHIYVDTWPGLWNDVPCDSYSYQPVCKLSKGEVTTPVFPTPAPGDCPSAEWVKYGDDCLLFRPLSYETWDSAQEFCQTADDTADLVVLDDGAKNYFVHQTVIDMTNEVEDRPNIWIGMYKTGLGQPYIWVDGTTVDYTNWAPGEPNDGTGTQNCVRLYYSPGNWDDTDCYDSLSQGFVCEAPVAARKKKSRHPVVRPMHDAEKSSILEKKLDEKLALRHMKKQMSHFKKQIKEPIGPQRTIMDNPEEMKESSSHNSLTLSTIAVICIVASIMVSALVGMGIYVYKKQSSDAAATVENPNSVTFQNPLAVEEALEFPNSDYQY